MARDRASIRIDMWGDDDWRDLSVGAQHLYMLLLSHPTLSYAGVADWKPGRLAAMTHGSSSASVVESAAELERASFIVIDLDTEEVLVRSFVKHDGLMKQPKLVVSMTTAFAAVASKRIRQVIAFEVQKLKETDPTLNAWGVKQVQTVLTASACSAANLAPALTPGVTPWVTPTVTPGVTPNLGQTLAEPTTTATTTSSKEDRSTAKRGARGTRVPDSFVITDEMRKWAAEEVPLVDLDAKLREWLDYWRSVPGQKGVKLDWVSTWRNGMRKQQEFAERDAARTQTRDPDAWMNRSTP